MDTPISLPLSLPQHWIVVYLVGGSNLSKKYEFVNSDDYSIPNCFWKVIIHSCSRKTTHQLCWKLPESTTQKPRLTTCRNVSGTPRASHPTISPSAKVARSSSCSGRAQWQWFGNSTPSEFKPSRPQTQQNVPTKSEKLFFHGKKYYTWKKMENICRNMVETFQILR